MNQPIPTTQENEPRLWDQQPEESNLWYNRFCEYLKLGASRSLRATYNAEKNNEVSKPVPSSWTHIASRFNWQERAKVYDAWKHQALFAESMPADDETLKKQETLMLQLYDVSARLYDRLVAEMDTMPVNDKFLAQYLATIDLLAKHLGSYAPQRIEHTGKDGSPIEVRGDEESKVRVVFYMPEVGSIQPAPRPLEVDAPLAPEPSL